MLKTYFGDQYLHYYLHVFLIFYFKIARKVHLEFVKVSSIQNFSVYTIFLQRNTHDIDRLTSSSYLYDYKIEQFQDTSSQNTYDESILFGFPYSFYILRIRI